MARGDGPALSPGSGAVTGTPSGPHSAVEAVWRIESARLVGALARYTGDFELAEDVAQDALAEALVAWPRDGVPDNPAGWLLTTGRRRAVDAFRRRSARDARYAAIGHTVETVVEDGAGLYGDPDVIDDDVLALMFVACHPVLSRDARVALTLRVVGGLTSEEIARALLLPLPTLQARITRAKKALTAARVRFEVPPADERADRLASVLNVVYVIFTEGSSATSGDAWIRHDLAREAVRLARVLARLEPAPEAFGLLALLELTAARFPARTDAAGRPVLLEDQDRHRWDRSAITRGRAALARASQGTGLGPYALQAAIAECHAVAASVVDTDWERIVLLYEGLRQIAPSPVVDLNHAVAVSMARGPDAGLRLVDGLAANRSLQRYHPLHVVRAELLRRLGRSVEARAAFLHAAAMCGNAAERAMLEERARKITDR